MFQNIVDDNKAKRDTLVAQAEHLEKSAATAADKLSSLIVDDLNEEVKQIHDTQNLIERESQLLKQELATVNQQLISWSGKTKELLETLKHTGDLEHYVAVLKREAAALATVLSAALSEPASNRQEPAATVTPAAAAVDLTTTSTGRSAADTSATVDDVTASCKQKHTQASSTTLHDTNQEVAHDALATNNTQSISGTQETQTLSDTDTPAAQPPPEQLPVSSRASR